MQPRNLPQLVRSGQAAPAGEEVDLRQVPRSERHPLIFARFDGLPVGDSLVLVNDHDPVPLHRQMDSLRPGQFAWESITRGPQIFRIRIRRTAPLTGSETSPAAPSATVVGIQPK